VTADSLGFGSDEATVPHSYIDLHSHMLPGIDDGCRNVEESLACVGKLIEHGFAGTVCTPHMGLDIFPENLPINVVNWVATLQEQLQAAGLEYRLWPGGELRIGEDTIPWLRMHGVPVLGPSRNVLVDYWGSHWPAYADSVIDHFFQEGYQPILAHPERMDFDDREWDDVLERLQQMGVLLQGNLKCIAGREGRRVGARALRLLREDRYHLLAIDMHGAPDLDHRLAGLSAVEQLVGAEKLCELISVGPQEILFQPR
jgi:protein-tyrosine phosphatase